MNYTKNFLKKILVSHIFTIDDFKKFRNAIKNTLFFEKDENTKEYKNPGILYIDDLFSCFENEMIPVFTENGFNNIKNPEIYIKPFKDRKTRKKKRVNNL